MFNVRRWAAWLYGLLLSLLALGVAGCGRTPTQSILNPASDPAARVTGLTWFLVILLGLIFLITLALLGFALFLRPPDRGDGSFFTTTRFVVISGILIPAAILFILLVASLNTTVALTPPETDLTVRVIGRQFWWEVHYPDLGITLANEIQIPTGRPVRLELTSGDVIHSFWVPRLNGKMDLIPGHENQFWIAAERPGTYRGKCAEFCGVQHAKMAFWVVALPPEQFEAWVADARRPRPEALAPQLAEGRKVFFRAGCDTCHAIRGTRAQGKRGPNLTHLGGRLSLGAGTIPNNTGNLQGWISNPQAIKPGNLMPRVYVAPKDLHALAAYLESLK